MVTCTFFRNGSRRDLLLKIPYTQAEISSCLNLVASQSTFDDCLPSTQQSSSNLSTSSTIHCGRMFCSTLKPALLTHSQSLCNVAIAQLAPARSFFDFASQNKMKEYSERRILG